MTPHGSDPNGAVNVDSLKKDLEFFEVKGDLSIEKVLDTSFLDAALKQLGPYKPAGL
jgi:NitT/TauT family transport system substrate-binding protein